MTSPSRLRSEVRFGMVPLWLIEADVTDRAVRLYAVLHGRWADQDGNAWPSRKTLARAIHCSPKSVDRAKEELSEIGALTWEQRHTSEGDYDVNLYTLVMKRREGVGTAVTLPMDTGGRGGRDSRAATVGTPVSHEPDPMEPDLKTGGKTEMATVKCWKEGCDSELPPEKFFCAEHLELIPEDLKRVFRNEKAGRYVGPIVLTAVQEARAYLGDGDDD